MKITLSFVFAFFTALSCFANSQDLIRTSDDHVTSSFETKAMAPANPSRSLVPGAFSQNVDHFGKATGTFHQRYWVNSEFASSSPQAPVLFHICGEGDAEDGYFLDDNALAWAKALGAHIVYLEHRYYGKSLPYADLSTEHLQYLTLENILEDFATFQKWLTSSKAWSGKWISIGGSYSGTLSALYRQKHPELVVGALASSAPMISGVGDSVGSSWDVAHFSSTEPSDGRPWIYQACTTFGFWQAQGASAGSTLENPSAWLCQQLFGRVGLVDSAVYNQKYDEPFLSNDPHAPSNILFTYGGEDVWTEIGLSQQTNHNPNITIEVIKGAGHHYDLNPPSFSDSAAVVKARNDFIQLAKKWLQEASQRKFISPALQN